jgi:hypothetical protein
MQLIARLTTSSQHFVAGFIDYRVERATICQNEAPPAIEKRRQHPFRWNSKITQVLNMRSRIIAEQTGLTVVSVVGRSAREDHAEVSP